MALGDQTLAAGWTTVNPNTDLVKDGADEITETRDLAASVKLETRPVNRGGTGATTRDGVRTTAVDLYVQPTAPAHSNGRLWIKTPS